MLVLTFVCIFVSRLDASMKNKSMPDKMRLILRFKTCLPYYFDINSTYPPTPRTYEVITKICNERTTELYKYFMSNRSQFTNRELFNIHCDSETILDNAAYWDTLRNVKDASDDHISFITTVNKLYLATS